MINVSGYEQDNDLVFVALPYGSYVIVGLDSKPTYFEVAYHSTPYKGIPPGFSGVVVDRCDLGFIYLVSRKQVISHYENIETGERLNIANSLETYAALFCKLRTNQSDHTEIAGILNKLLKTPEEVSK